MPHLWRDPLTDTLGIAAAEQAIEAHKTFLRIEGDSGIQAWHLLLSLREFCAAKNISFDELLADTKRHIVEFGKCDAA